MRCRQFACCRSGKRRSTHVTTYPSRGVGLHTRRPREATTSLAIPEVLQQGEGRISQLFQADHQFRRNSALKRGVRDSPHRGRSYGPCTRKRRPRHLRKCRSVQGLTGGDRKWGPSSKTLPSTSAWSNDPSTPKKVESSWGSSQPRESWRLPQAGQDLAPFGKRRLRQRHEPPMTRATDTTRGGLGKSFYSRKAETGPAGGGNGRPGYL